MRTNPLAVNTLDGIVAHRGSDERKSEVVRSHPLGKPKNGILSKYLGAKVQQYCATITDATRSTSLHDKCALCVPFASKAGKNGKLKTSVFKTLAKLHSSSTKTCLSHLKMKLSKNASTTETHNKEGEVEVPGPIVAAPEVQGSEPPQKKSRLCFADISVDYVETRATEIAPTQKWIKVSRKRSVKQRRQKKLLAISELEQQCESLDSQIMAAKRGASDPLCSESKRAGILAPLPRLKQSKLELVKRLAVLRPTVSRK